MKPVRSEMQVEDIQRFLKRTRQTADDLLASDDAGLWLPHVILCSKTNN